VVKAVPVVAQFAIPAYDVPAAIWFTPLPANKVFEAIFVAQLAQVTAALM